MKRLRIVGPSMFLFWEGLCTWPPLAVLGLLLVAVGIWKLEPIEEASRR